MEAADQSAATPIGATREPGWLSRVLWWDLNSWIHLAFIAATVGACFAIGWWGLLVYPALHGISDLLYYFKGIQVFDPSITIQRGYQLSLAFNDTPHSQGLDYGFNFYDGDYEKSRAQAQVDKFTHAFAELGLKPGMKVIDVGCGCGDWLNYLREQGVEAVGVNITFAQTEVCRERGLTVYWTDWKDILKRPELQADLYGQFDRVTFWDTVEHYVPLKYNYNPEKQDEIYSDMFRLARNLLRDPAEGRVFISCLHTRFRFKDMPLTWALVKKSFYVYLLDKFHSGSYPSGTKDCLVRNAKPLFELERREDLTLDYYMTSKLEPTHFGRHKFRWTPRRFAIAAWMLVSDPFWLHRAAWFKNESWMDQFNEADIEKSDMLLWWLTLRGTAE